MSKSVWKLPPYEYFEVDAIAGWLDELSRRGLQLETKFGPFCLFRRDHSTYRYRLDIRRSGDARTDDERIDAYRIMGWNFVTDYTQNAEVYRTTDPTTELHTDEELLCDLVKRGCRRQLWQCATYLCYIILFIFWHINGLLRDCGSLSAIFSDPPYRLLFCACLSFILILLINIAVILIGYGRLKKHRFTQYTVHTPKRARWGVFWWIMRIFLAVLFLFTMVSAFILTM